MCSLTCRLSTWKSGVGPGADGEEETRSPGARILASWTSVNLFFSALVDRRARFLSVWTEFCELLFT